MSDSENPRKLTAKSAAFIEYCLVDPNYTKAAIAAGYSPRTASAMAYKLVRHPSVKAELARRRAQQAKKMEITQEKVLQEIARVAFANMGDFASWGNGLCILKPSLDVDAKVVESVKVDTQGNVSIKLHNKLKALDMLCKHLGLYEETKDESARQALIELMERLERHAGSIEIKPNYTQVPKQRPAY